MDTPKRTIVMIDPEEYKRRKDKKDRQDIKMLAITPPAPSATEGWRYGERDNGVYNSDDDVKSLNWAVYGVIGVIVFSFLIAMCSGVLSWVLSSR